MIRPNLTSVAAWLTALAAAAAFPASAQPIDLLAPPSVTAPPSPLPVTPAQPAASPPVVTYALLPGHWQLQGAQYVWVLPDTVPRPVVSGRLVQGHYVWRAGEWIWVPAHFDRQPGDRDHFSGKVMRRMLTQPENTLARAERVRECAATAPAPPGRSGHGEGRGRRRSRADSDFGTHQ